MNKRIQSAILAAFIITGFSCSTGKTEIAGIVSGGEGTTLTLERLDVNQTLVIDSVNIGSDGSFQLRTTLEEPELFILKSQNGEIVNLLLSPEEKLFLKTNYTTFGSDYQVDGSEESEGIRLLVEHLDKTRKVLDSLNTEAFSIDNPESPQLELIRTAYAQTIVKQKRYTIKYLVENMTSLSSVYALYQKYDEENYVLGWETDLQYFKSVADSLEISQPNSSLTKSLRTDIERREARFNEAIKLNSMLEMADEASGMLDLTIPNREGNKVALSTLKGNVVLITFWASGNEASIQTLLLLQSTYNKYHDRGFEIYAISLDNNKINWMNALDYNEFNWINVSELSYPESNAALLYNVSAIPATFLMNREGDIVAKNLFGRSLEIWLDNLI